MKILHAIIRNYLETGEPVGSRTISKYTDLNLSSATIRNEMADLEELGYIIQPHTSAGRIPSDKGYRLYVDSMLEEKDREVDDLKGLLVEKEDKMEHLLQHVAKNTMLHVEQAPDEETMLKLNILLNTHLNGKTLDEINLGMIANMKQQAGIHSVMVGEIIDAVAEAIQADEDLQIYTSGTNNILKYPELADKEKAGELITAFEEKKALNQIVQETLADENSTGIQVYIGNESPVQTMRDCSVVTATYELGEGMKGTVGIIGPKRMDYDKVVRILKNLMNQLETLYKKT